MRVHYFEDLPQQEKELLTRALDDSIQISTGSQIPDQPDYEILISGVPTEEALTASPHLHSLIIPWAGFPRKTRELLMQYPDIKIYNIHHNAVTTAETAVALLQTVAKEIIPLDRNLREHDWTKRYQPTGAIKLSRKKALILGYGHIGQQIEKLLSGYEMQISKIRRTNSDPEQQIYSLEALPALLPAAEILFVALPWTDSTDQLLGKSELPLLPDNSIIINISRGNIIDEQALFEELQTGRISAGIDVWYSYPQDESEYTNTPVGSQPFEKLDNLVMTPHIAGHSTETASLRITHLISLLQTIKTSPHTARQIDLKEGY